MGSALIAVVDSAKMQRTAYIEGGWAPVQPDSAGRRRLGFTPGVCDELAADTRNSIEHPTGAPCERATIALQIAGRHMEIAVASTEGPAGRENAVGPFGLRAAEEAVRAIVGDAGSC